MRLGLNGRFYAAPVTGVQRFAREVFARLPSRVPATLFLPAGARPPEDGATPTAVQAGSRSSSGTPPRSTEDGTTRPVVRGRLAGHAWEQLELPWRARAAGCDVVLHASGTAPLAGGPHVMVIHDLLPLSHPEWFSRAFSGWYRLVVARAARRAAAIITPSEWTRSEIVRLLGVPAPRIRTVAQGLAPFDSPAPPEDVEAIRARLALPGPYILAAGAGDRRKNIRFLLRMLDRWRSTGLTVPTLVVVGARRERVHGRTEDEVAAPTGVVGHVRRLGYVADADLRALYTGASVFCFPSLAEGFGRPPLEAMACGTPAVVADYPAAREVLGGAAVVLPLEPDAWIDAVRVLLEDPQTRAARVARGTDVAARYDWDSAADAVADVCLATAGGGSSKAAAAGGGPKTTPTAGSSKGGDHRRRTGGGGHRQSLEAANRRRRAEGGAPGGGAVMRVAVVHDWLTGMRGGERCLEALLELFPAAEIFTLLHRPGTVSPLIEDRPIHTSFVQRLPAAGRAYRYYLPLFPAAVERFEPSGFDLVVSSSHCVAKGVRPPPGVPHLCYCHTPMRYVWDQYDAYFGRGRARPWVRAAMPLIARRLRAWDAATADRVDVFVANSGHTAARIRRYYGREAEVVHPPVDVARFTPAARREDFYLIVSALVPYKRIDIAVRALNELRRPLVVVGDGPERRRLRALAGPTVRFTGRLPDDEVAGLMARCRAFVHPAVEDFGIAAVEAQAAGAPVIALAGGGALETVIGHDGNGEPADGQPAASDPAAAPTGLFFRRQTAADLAGAVRRFERLDFDPLAAAANARRFDGGDFGRRIAARVARLLEDGA